MWEIDLQLMSDQIIEFDIPVKESWFNNTLLIKYVILFCRNYIGMVVSAWIWMSQSRRLFCVACGYFYSICYLFSLLHSAEFSGLFLLN